MSSYNDILEAIERNVTPITYTFFRHGQPQDMDLDDEWADRYGVWLLPLQASSSLSSNYYLTNVWNCVLVFMVFDDIDTTNRVQAGNIAELWELTSEFLVRISEDEDAPIIQNINRDSSFRYSENSFIVSAVSVTFQIQAPDGFDYCKITGDE